MEDLPDPGEHRNDNPRRSSLMDEADRIWVVTCAVQKDDGDEWHERGEWHATDLDSAFKAADSHMRVNQSEFYRLSTGEVMYLTDEESGKRVKLAPKPVYRTTLP